MHARVHDLATVGIRVAAVHAATGEVDDDIVTGHGPTNAFRIEEVELSSDARHLVPARPEKRHCPATDNPGRSSDENPHDLTNSAHFILSSRDSHRVSEEIHGCDDSAS